MIKIPVASLKCGLVALLIVAVSSVPWWYKKPIEHATYDELVSICGIGETRAVLVLKSGADDIDDLYRIDGIGDKTVFVLKKKYR